MNSSEDILKRRSLGNMQRISRQEMADRLDELIDIMSKEDIGFVITKDGKDDLVFCPADWIGEYGDPDNGLIIICAVRYAIGRSTYMPDAVIRFIERNISSLDERTLRCVIQDLSQEDNCEKLPFKEAWMNLKEQLEEQLRALLSKKKEE